MKIDKLKEIVTKIYDKVLQEKHLSQAETNKKEEIVKAMKKDFKGDKSSLYAIATARAKKLAEDVANVSNIGGASFQSGQGEQYASPKAFSKGERMTIRKSFLKELIQKEIKNIKK